MNLSEKLHNSMVSSPNTPFIFENEQYTFGNIDIMSRKTAAFLKDAGVKFGDRVALQMPKSMEFIYFHLSNMMIGAITLPLNTGYGAKEIEYFLSDSGSTFFITYRENYVKLKNVLDGLNIKTILIDAAADNTLFYLDEIKQYTPIKPDFSAKGSDAAMIGYTSGTTGRSKGAIITHDNLVFNMEALEKTWRWTNGDVLLHVLPLFHFHGLGVALHGALNAKSKVIMHKKFDPMRIWDTIEKDKITMFMGVPTLYHRMVQSWHKLKQKPDISSMRVFISGSAPLGEKLFYQFEQITGHKILERYGMTEAGMIASNPYENTMRIPKSVGYALDGCKIKVVKNGSNARPEEIGNVYIKGNNIFKGYWGMPQKTKDSFTDGWFETGDMGYMDKTGRLFLAGRSKNMIITGGFNVYPKEVEYILEEHSCVDEAVVFSMEDKDLGERVEAAAVLIKHNCITADDLTAFCKDRIAHYKCPKKIHIVKQIPKNAMGKIVIDEIKKLL